MNKAETLKILTVLQVSYPAFYKNMTDQDIDTAVDLWHSRFQNEPYQLVDAAVRALIDGDEKGYPPNIGAVKGYIRRLTQQEEMSEAEAWAIASKAVQSFDWTHPQKTFDALPERIQKAIGSVSVMVEWGKSPVEQFNTVIASNFQRSYRAIAAREKEYNALPEDVRLMISGISNRMALTASVESEG